MEPADEGHSEKPFGNGVGWNITLYTNSTVDWIIWEDCKYNHISYSDFFLFCIISLIIHNVIILYIFVYKHLK